VAPVERCELGLSEHFGRGDHRRIDETEREVAIVLEQLACSEQPAKGQIEQLETTRAEVGQ
jgi:hypothetical protein